MKNKAMCQSILFDLTDIFSEDFKFLLQRLLAGFVGKSIEMKSSTIIMLSDLVSYQKSEMEKADTEVKRMSNHFKASE